MCRTSPSALIVIAVCTIALEMLPAAQALAEDRSASEPAWQTDYQQAVDLAKQQRRMLFAFFHGPDGDKTRKFFESKVLTEPGVAEKLQDYVCAKLPLGAKIRIDDEETTVLEHAAFNKLHRQQGVAVLDFAHQATKYYGRVVTALPFGGDQCYSARQMLLVLDLSPGTAKERMREFAARNRLLPALAEEESSTSQQKEPKVADTATAGPERVESPKVDVTWHADYAEATQQARQQRKMLLVCFDGPEGNAPYRRFKMETLGDTAVRRRLKDYVCAKLPLNAETTVDGQPLKVIEEAGFEEMLGRPGVAVVDFAHEDAPWYGSVVSTFPITKKLSYTPERMKVILDLPPGTLTQRTLIYAVRIHPEKPASTAGEIDPHLLGEAESHSRYQARIRLQGHHRWETRFRRINALLPRGLVACEVCAESWPGEHLVEAAIECVRCWRFSSGHWSAVRARHRVYGYDMKRGANGIWYATGIFGKG